MPPQREPEETPVGQRSSQGSGRGQEAKDVRSTVDSGKVPAPAKSMDSAPVTGNSRAHGKQQQRKPRRQGQESRRQQQQRKEQIDREKSVAGGANETVQREAEGDQAAPVRHEASGTVEAGNTGASRSGRRNRRRGRDRGSGEQKGESDRVHTSDKEKHSTAEEGGNRETSASGAGTEKMTAHCHADSWLASPIPVCMFGGQRKAGADDRQSRSKSIRPFPYRACMHRIKPQGGASEKRAFIDEYSPERRRWKIGKRKEILPEYAVYIQGPFFGFEVGREQEMIWGSNEASRTCLKRIANIQGALSVWDLTDPDGSDAQNSQFGRELCLSFHVVTESNAKDFMQGLEHRLLGLYYQSEAERLAKSKFVNKAIKAEVRAKAADSMHAFFNCKRSKFEIDLQHMSETEAESGLVKRMEEISSTDVAPQQQEKFLEVCDFLLQSIFDLVLAAAVRIVFSCIQ